MAITICELNIGQQFLFHCMRSQIDCIQQILVTNGNLNIRQSQTLKTTYYSSRSEVVYNNELVISTKRASLIKICTMMWLAVWSAKDISYNTTNCIKQCPPWETNSRTSSQKSGHPFGTQRFNIVFTRAPQRTMSSASPHPHILFA